VRSNTATIVGSQMEAAMVDASWNPSTGTLPVCEDWDSFATPMVAGHVQAEKAVIFSAIANGVGAKKYLFVGKFSIGDGDVYHYCHCGGIQHGLLFRMPKPSIILTVKIDHEPIIGGKSIATGTLLSGATPVSQVYRSEDTIRALQLRDSFHVKLIAQNMITRYTRVILVFGTKVLRGNVILKHGSVPTKYGKWPKAGSCGGIPMYGKGQQRITKYFKPFFKKKGLGHGTFI